MRPVVSMVTWTCSATERPHALIARRRRHRRLGLQEVVARLDDEQVDAAFEQAARLFLVRIAQIGETDVPERWQFGAGPDRSGDEAGPPVGGEIVGHPPRCEPPRG
jgi:hypothetical protein